MFPSQSGFAFPRSGPLSTPALRHEYDYEDEVQTGRPRIDQVRYLIVRSMFLNDVFWQANIFQNSDINSVVGAATGEQLIKAHNNAYIQLLLEKTNLE